jgi:hypothetical protein
LKALVERHKELLIAVRTDEGLQQKLVESPPHDAELAMFCLEEAIELLDSADVPQGTHAGLRHAQEAHLWLRCAANQLKGP